MKKLSRAQIPVYDLKKRKNRLYFCVEEEYREKVFAIFSHSCYNIRIEHEGLKKRALQFMQRRLGLILGFALFLTAITLSQNFIFAVNVKGSGAYLESEVKKIVQESGVRMCGYLSEPDKPYIISRVLALPNVTFCSVQRQGCALNVDVRCDGSQTQRAQAGGLKTDIEGELMELVAISGTPLLKVGQRVQRGQELIGNYELDEEGAKIPCLCAGYARIKSEGSCLYAADCESEQNAAQASRAPLVWSDNAQILSLAVRKADEGVVYEVWFAFERLIYMNME